MNPDWRETLAIPDQLSRRTVLSPSQGRSGFSASNTLNELVVPNRGGPGLV